jgi:translation initiation factor 1
MSGRLVYSTDSGSSKKEKKSSAYTPATGPTKMRLETSGRGGKAVTVLWNLPFDEDMIKSIMKDVQAKKACGATFKNGRVEFQGNIKEAVLSYFTEKGLKIVQAGA